MRKFWNKIFLKNTDTFWKNWHSDRRVQTCNCVLRVHRITFNEKVVFLILIFLSASIERDSINVDFYLCFPCILKIDTVIKCNPEASRDGIKAKSDVSDCDYKTSPRPCRAVKDRDTDSWTGLFSGCKQASGCLQDSSESLHCFFSKTFTFYTLFVSALSRFLFFVFLQCYLTSTLILHSVTALMCVCVS